MKRSLLAGILLASLALAKTFTLEQVLSAPFPYELIAAPGGGKVAWLLNERGARNVWTVAAPDFKGVRLTNYTRDDGQDVGQIRWTPDAKAVVYVRGGDLEFLGRPDPNPTADPAGVDQSIWIAAPGEAPRKIAAGHSPVVSPKGDRLAYLLGGQIWLAPLSGAGAASLLIQARAGVTAGQVRWSPDGGKLAYVSDRTNHSFIAVYDFATQSLSYLDPSVDRDANPTWSPDGKQVAFTRMTSGGGGGLYLRTRADVDAAHIGLWGGSYGGYLTALGLARASSLFAAGGDFHGVHDWSTRITANADAARTAFESSPMASVRTWRSPGLLIHGDDDRNVNFSETITLANALRQQGVYFEQLILPDEIHGFLRHASWLRDYHAAADFFRRKL